MFESKHHLEEAEATWPAIHQKTELATYLVDPTPREGEGEAAAEAGVGGAAQLAPGALLVEGEL